MEIDEYRRMAQVEHSHWWYDSTRRLLQQLLAAEVTTGGRFLDVGAGTGATGAWLAEHGSLVASDFNIRLFDEFEEGFRREAVPEKETDERTEKGKCGSREGFRVAWFHRIGNLVPHRG